MLVFSFFMPSACLNPPLRKIEQMNQYSPQYLRSANQEVLTGKQSQIQKYHRQDSQEDTPTKCQRQCEILRVKTKSKAGWWGPGEVHQGNNGSRRGKQTAEGKDTFHISISDVFQFVETFRLTPDMVPEEAVRKHLKVSGPRACVRTWKNKCEWLWGTKGQCRSWMEEAQASNGMWDKMMRSPLQVGTLTSGHAASRRRDVRPLKEQYATKTKGDFHIATDVAGCRGKCRESVCFGWARTANVTNLHGNVPPFGVCFIGGYRRRPALISPDKFKYELKEKTTTTPLWHRDFTSCLIPPVRYCDTPVGVSCSFGETINPLSGRMVPLSPEASNREPVKNWM